MTPEDTALSVSTLTAAERRTLLRLARNSIRAALDGAAIPRLDASTSALDAPSGVFVSLHEGSRLRGCVGTVTAERPLYENVARMARAAAFDDPRFPPMAAAELARISIEISRLGRLTSARPDEVQPGVHGVCVQHGAQRAVFLPQVATKQRWGRETLLNELCSKACLPPDAWTQADTQLMIFVAEVFSEADDDALP
jgi:AmmeMemoRadiSam system protein A